jgi:hypothetical protein
MNKSWSKKVSAEPVKWYSVTVSRIGDPDGLMVIEIKGRGQQDAAMKLADVLRIQAVHVIANTWQEL